MSRVTRFAIVAVFAGALAAVVAVKARDRVPRARTDGIAQGRPRLVDLGADRCLPCKAMAPILEELRAEYAGRLEVTFIDVWQDPQAAAPFRIQVIPTQIFYDPDGRELARHEGFLSKADILAQWGALGVKL